MRKLKKRNIKKLMKTYVNKKWVRSKMRSNLYFRSGFWSIFSKSFMYE